MSTKVEATIDDLLKVKQKAEIVNGEIILMSPTGVSRVMPATKYFPHCAITANFRNTVGLSAITRHSS